MVKLPVLSAPLFAENEKLAVPLPVPLLPEVIVAQFGELVAVQAQLLDEAVILTLPVPPVEVKV